MNINFSARFPVSDVRKTFIDQLIATGSIPENVNPDDLVLKISPRTGVRFEIGEPEEEVPSSDVATNESEPSVA